LFTVFAKLVFVDQHGADFFEGVDILVLPILNDHGTNIFSSVISSRLIGMGSLPVLP
jgi:hypothetical protein